MGLRDIVMINDLRARSLRQLKRACLRSRRWQDDADVSLLPPGSESIAHYAQMRGLAYQPAPEPDWYRQWEPFDTIVAPSHYYNAIVGHVGGARTVIAEPWHATEGMEPLGRSLFAFVSDETLTFRAAARLGASHLTRVAFLGDSPPRQQSTGDPTWDDVAITFAESPLAAVRAFTPSLRKLLVSWSFQGHMEMRPGGFVLHLADARPTPGDYERLAAWIPKVIETARKQRR